MKEGLSFFRKRIPAAGEESCGVAKRSRGCGSFFTSRQGQSFCTSRTVRWYTVSPESGSVRVTVTVSIS